MRGAQERFVSETTGFLIDRLTSIDFRDYDTEYWVRRMASENERLLLDIYAKYRDEITDDARAILEDAILDEDLETALQRVTGHTAVSAPYSAGVARITSATVANCTKIIERQNVAMVAQQADLWYSVAIDAVAKTTGAMETTDRIMAEAVRALSERQIRTIDYKSGVSTNIDAAIRRHVVTQANQAYQRMSEARATEYDWDLVMCSSHPASRPEHYYFQGEIFSKGRYVGQRIDGHTVQPYDDLDVGDVTGIYGANCRHYLTVYVPGYSEVQEPPYGYEENERRYDLTQDQRRMEREIRYTKADVADLQRAGLDDTQARLKLGTQQAKIRAFCNENGLTRRYDLEKAYGIPSQPRAIGGTRKAAAKAAEPRKPQQPEKKHEVEPIRPQTPKYAPFATAKEAEAYLEGVVPIGSYGAKLDISKIDIDAANGLCKAVHDVTALYDVEIRSIQPMNFRTNMFKGSTADAAYQFLRHDLFYNPNFYKTKKALDAHIAEALSAEESTRRDIVQFVESGKHFSTERLDRYARGFIRSGRGNVGNSYPERWSEATFMHELGHALDDQVFRRAYKDRGFDIRGSFEKYAENVSGYATSSNMEYVAESFAAYMFGEREGLDPALVAIFDEVRK